MNRWRSTKDALPKIGLDVLCYFGDHVPMDVGIYSGGDIWSRAFYDMGVYDMNPSYWMPLPNPPIPTKPEDNQVTPGFVEIDRLIFIETPKAK